MANWYASILSDVRQVLVHFHLREKSRSSSAVIVIGKPPTEGVPLGVKKSRCVGCDVL